MDRKNSSINAIYHFRKGNASVGKNKCIYKSWIIYIHNWKYYYL
nr:MAG TPA: hypothetical protein [Caudoviricetes sp.]